MVNPPILREGLSTICDEELPVILATYCPFFNLVFREEKIPNCDEPQQDYGLETAERCPGEWGKGVSRFLVEAEWVKQLLHMLLLEILVPDAATVEERMDKLVRITAQSASFMLYKPPEAGNYIRVEEYREGRRKSRRSVLRVSLRVQILPESGRI